METKAYKQMTISEILNRIEKLEHSKGLVERVDTDVTKGNENDRADSITNDRSNNLIEESKQPYLDSSDRAELYLLNFYPGGMEHPMTFINRVKKF